MMEVLTGMSQGVTGFRVSGKVDGDQLREFTPTMETLLDADEIRLVEVVSDDYQGFGAGGLVEDLKTSLGILVQHHSAFRRIAIVSDIDWVSYALHVFAWMVPGELKMFGIDDLDQASAWAAG
jgi:SpoIIAA-like